MKGRLMCFGFCALQNTGCSYHEDSRNCGHFLVESHKMCHAVENLGMEDCDLLTSYS